MSDRDRQECPSHQRQARMSVSPNPHPITVPTHSRPVCITDTVAMFASVASSPAPRSPLSKTVKRLWKAVGIAVIFVATFVVVNVTMLPADKQLRAGDLGHDFLAFYTAGTFARQGQFARMYDMDAVRDFEFGVAGAIGLQLGPGFMPWWNPPFAAIPFEALSTMPYRSALMVWLTINLTAVAAAVWMLTAVVRCAGNRGSRIEDRGSQLHKCDALGDPRSSTLDLRPIGWPTWALVPALVACSVPFILSLTHGQNTGVSLLVITAVAMLWRARWGFAAGLVCGLMFYKPQLGALVAVALSSRLGWRATAGVACTGVALLAVTLLHMPGALEAFLFKMPANLAAFQETNQYYWERHITFKGLWRLLFQGHQRGPTAPVVVALWALSTVVLGGGLLWVLGRWRGRVTEDKAIAATIVCSPLVMPFYFDYDLLLMAVPVALYAAERLSRTERSRLDGKLTAAWCAVAGYMVLQPHVAEATNINVTAILLTACATLTLVWAGRCAGAARDEVLPITEHTILPAAA
jgi:hypothetical protein